MNEIYTRMYMFNCIEETKNELKKAFFFQFEFNGGVH